MTVRTLLAGDHFVSPDLLRAALSDAGLTDRLALTDLTLEWPHVPYGEVDEVDEASGTAADLLPALEGVEVLVSQMAPVTEEVLAASPDLRLVVVCRGGPVNVNLGAARERGVTVCATPGRNAAAAAEHAVALMLAAMRQIPQVHATVLDGQWRSDLYALDRVGTELNGTAVGLVGLGAIGHRVARILEAFGARVRAYDPYAEPGEVELVPLEELLATSEVLSLHARVTPETAGMIGAEQLAALPRGATLVNTARGALLDYDAAAACLESGQLGAAGFDVFDSEPLAADSAIRRAPRTVLTPHLAGATRQTAERAATMAAEVVGAYVDGRQVPWVQQG